MANEMLIHPAIQGCIHVLERCELMLDRIPEALYTVRDGDHDSIGSHLRHGIEHFTCFLDGLGNGMIDYDLRDRDEVIETDIVAARTAIAETRIRLMDIDAGNLGKSIQIVQIPSPGLEPASVSSSVVRELLFLSSHTIHHLSLMYIHCTKAGVDLPKDFPLAFSTSAYRNVSVG